MRPIGDTECLAMKDTAAVEATMEVAVEPIRASRPLLHLSFRAKLDIDYHSPQRICNGWTITEEAYPKQRIKVGLIDQDLGR